MPPSEPRMVGRREALIIGHRGAPGYRPEHTRASYALALAQAADAVEPDLVASRDGVLLIRHENEISGTTDVASRPEFAHRRTTKEVDGRSLTGWFTEDFTWAELSTLRAVERLPGLRPSSAAFDGRFPMMRFRELLSLLAGAEQEDVGLVAELKHASYFSSIGLPLDELLEIELSESPIGRPSSARLVIESFEKSVLTRLRGRGVEAKYVYLLEAEGSAFDLVACHGAEAPTYAEELADEQLAALGRRPPTTSTTGLPAGLDGISVSKSIILEPSADGHVDLVPRAHAAGLEVYCWTFRPENAFLSPRFRSGPPGSFGRWRDELETLIEAGVDGLFLDHPDLARAGRRAEG